MDAVCGYSRKRGQGVPSSEYGGILDCLQKAPNFLKNVVFERVKFRDGRHQWIHNVLLACYDVRMLSPDTMEVYVPGEADLGATFDPDNPRKEGAYCAEGLRKVGQEWRKQLLHPKLTATEAMLNWFPAPCMDAEYIRRHNLPGPFILGPFQLVFLARLTPG